MRYVIVGGVAAGVTAATRLRRLDETADIVLLERGEKISFANCALPYYAGGIVRFERLYAADAATISEQYAVDIRERHEALSIDRERKTLAVRNLATNETYELSYDKLILATGAEPVFPEVEGLAENARALWRVEDALALEKALSEKAGLTALVLGGGSVGLEAAENIVRRGGTAHLVTRGATLLGKNDPALSRLFVRFAQGKEKRLLWHFGTTAAKVEHLADGRLRVALTNGETLEVDYLLSAAGVRPRSELAVQAGLELGPRDTIRTDLLTLTSDPDILAAGDVAASLDPETLEPRPLMLAGSAVRSGRKAADTASGRVPESKLQPPFATHVVSLFGTVWASTGKNVGELLACGQRPRRDFDAVTVIARNHVGWYPGSNPVILKIVFDKAGKLLGAQAIGREGADKRIDVLSTAMLFGANVRDLTKLDLCYSPQTGSAKDPIHAAAFVAENVLNGLVRFIEPGEVADLFAGREPDLGDDVPNTPDRACILDVRSSEEIADDALPLPYESIPLEELRDRLDEVPADGRTIVVVCRAGVRAFAAARILEQKGFKNVFVMTGGKQYWNWTMPKIA